MARWDRRPKTFSFKPKDEDEYRIVDENMSKGNYESFSDMVRDALVLKNEQLKEEATA